MMKMQIYSVSRDDTIYEAWPDLLLTDSGKLICVFTECRDHLNREDSRLVWCESTDRGRTWSEKHPLTERGTKTCYYDCARISKVDGRLVIICERLMGEHENTSDIEIHAWWSDDDGCTWDGPHLLPGKGIVPDKLKELSSGRWLLAAHRYCKDTGKLQQYLWYSDDKGKTWSDRVVVAADPRYNLCEVSILEVSPNTLIAYMRENSGMGWDCLKTISTDGGETWSEISLTPIPGCHRPVTGFLKDGRMLMTYRFMHGGGGGFGRSQNFMGALMAPESLLNTDRKEQVRIFPIDYDRAKRPDQGYSGWVQFDDGEIYVVNYIVDDAPYGQIRGYSFYPEDICL